MNHRISADKVFLVGGAVRDQLLGLDAVDRDYVVTQTTSQQMLDLGFEPVGKDFPVFLHPITKAEYALTRTERKQGQGYHGFTCIADGHVSLEDDLARRDLTINAMALNHQGQLIDPYGGQKDLSNRLLRHVSPAFIEDPLRVLRVARFAAQLAPFDFQLAPETLLLLQHMSASGELNHLIPERVWQECNKAFKTRQPGRFIATLRQINALNVLFPSVNQLYGVPQNPIHHPEICTGIHTEMVMNAATELSHANDHSGKDTINHVYMAMTHDLGKGITDATVWPSHPDHESRGVPLTQHLSTQLKVPKHTARLAKLFTRWHGEIHQGPDHGQAERLIAVLHGCQAIQHPQQFEQLLLLAEADHRGRLGFEHQPYPQSDFWRQAVKIAASIHVKHLPQMQGNHPPQGRAIADLLRQTQIQALSSWLNQNAPCLTS